ncbi:MAG TPA: DUF2865 domain-containing protein [Xanthobacteraceae bacterium]|nr:DUF2865 domain-containing protein [Xanthobacteraceae bacterium]
MRNAMSRGLVIGAVLAASLVGATPAAADNPFLSFLRGDWLRPRTPPPVSLPQIDLPPPSSGLAVTINPRGSGRGVVYCVRTCDGRYFPLGGVAPYSGQATDRCNEFCPAATTQVFVSRDAEAGIDAAYAKDGEPYSALPNAYVYRTQIKDDCRCNAGSALGVEPLDIRQDPTLKPGDLVVTETGVMVFRGGSQLPHRPEDFRAARGDGKLPAATRRQIEAIELASGALPGR